ncbi:hypothetical protein [Glutamicibacter ardleyensis]|uniref:hypothetical protein n=1 Tax=Glutamicibacter ardleyensis TaxID=225894 RepID=UPI003F8F7D74
MSSEAFDIVSLGFEFHARESEAAQKVFDVLNSRGLIGYVASPSVADQLTFVSVDVATDIEGSLLLATEAGGLAKHERDVEQLAAELMEAVGAQALSVDGTVVSGAQLEDADDVYSASGESRFQVVAGTDVVASELILCSVGQEGVWRAREDENGLLAVRAGEPVELRLGQKKCRAIELKGSEGYYQISVHALDKTFQMEGSAVLDYWMPVQDIPVPVAATGSAVARLQEKLGAQLYAADSEELSELKRLWPEAAEGIASLSRQRSLDGLRLFLTSLGLPGEMVQYAQGEQVPDGFAELPRSLWAGINLAAEEEIARAKGVMRIVYRTGWSPAALIASSLALLGAGVFLNRWMKNAGKPNAGWRRTIMFFWHSDAGYHLARGVRDVLNAKLKNRSAHRG